MPKFTTFDEDDQRVLSAMIQETGDAGEGLSTQEIRERLRSANFNVPAVLRRELRALPELLREVLLMKTRMEDGTHTPGLLTLGGLLTQLQALSSELLTLPAIFAYPAGRMAGFVSGVRLTEADDPADPFAAFPIPIEVKPGFPIIYLA